MSEQSMGGTGWTPEGASDEPRANPAVCPTCQHNYSVCVCFRTGGPYDLSTSDEPRERAVGEIHWPIAPLDPSEVAEVLANRKKLKAEFDEPRTSLACDMKPLPIEPREPRTVRDGIGERAMLQPKSDESREAWPPPDAVVCDNCKGVFLPPPCEFCGTGKLVPLNEVLADVLAEVARLEAGGEPRLGQMSKHDILIKCAATDIRDLLRLSKEGT